MGVRLAIYLTLALFISSAFAGDGDDCGEEEAKTCGNDTCDYCRTYGTDCVCADVRPQFCGDDPNCELIQKCIPRSQTCTSNSCPRGQRCQLDEVVCIVAPCIGNIILNNPSAINYAQKVTEIRVAGLLERIMNKLAGEILRTVSERDTVDATVPVVMLLLLKTLEDKHNFVDVFKIYLNKTLYQR